MDQYVVPDVVMASNTSGLSITEMASVTSDPGRVIGVHFFNPVPVMQLVELIRGYDTREETYQKAKQFVDSLGKESIDVKESPLFAVNRILVPMINEAIFVLQEGIASAEDIDKGMNWAPTTPSARWRWPIASVWIHCCLSWIRCMKKPRIPNIVPLPCCEKWCGQAIWAERPAGVFTSTSNGRACTACMRVTQKYKKLGLFVR